MDGACIIDVQFVIGKNSEYIIKELSILPENSSSPAEHKIFKPPYTKTELDDILRAQNSYNCANINGLLWECGVSEFNDIKTTLEKYKNYNIIVQGSEKKRVLAQYLPAACIFDLSNCMKSLKYWKDLPFTCAVHNNNNIQRSKCTQNNVQKIQRYLNNAEWDYP